MRILLSLRMSLSLFPRQLGSHVQGGFAGSKVRGLEMLGGSQVLSAERALVRSGCMNKTTVARFSWAPKYKRVENRDKPLMG